MSVCEERSEELGVRCGARVTQGAACTAFARRCSPVGFDEEERRFRRRQDSAAVAKASPRPEVAFEREDLSRADAGWTEMERDKTGRARTPPHTSARCDPTRDTGSRGRRHVRCGRERGVSNGAAARLCHPFLRPPDSAAGGVIPPAGVGVLPSRLHDVQPGPEVRQVRISGRGRAHEVLRRGDGGHGREVRVMVGRDEAAHRSSEDRGGAVPADPRACASSRFGPPRLKKSRLLIARLRKQEGSGRITGASQDEDRRPLKACAPFVSVHPELLVTDSDTCCSAVVLNGADCRAEFERAFA